ncbi:MAG: magnesium transporter MgtC [Chitinophaga sp.]|jgi:putative Mg2+ transporter-C (MgtC) family protein|nr:magnesium transporter MgtC [Chitinophaga sp.]
MSFEAEHIYKILFAFAAGALLGFEREFRSKPAGLRTMILISVGSCLFSILSSTFVTNSDRIASNIVTGIGFIGAGVIFKEGISIRGITSAATIWISAAIGMTIGFGYYGLALIVVALVLTTLVVLSKLEEWLDNVHQNKLYVIHINAEDYSVDELETAMQNMNIYFVRYKVVKNNRELIINYKIETKRNNHEKLNEFLIQNKKVIAFEL